MKSSKVYVGRELMLNHRVCDLVLECLRNGWSTVELCNEWESSPDITMISKKEMSSAPEFFTTMSSDSENEFSLYVNLTDCQNEDYLFRYLIPRLLFEDKGKKKTVEEVAVLLETLRDYLQKSDLMKSDFCRYIDFSLPKISYAVADCKRIFSNEPGEYLRCNENNNLAGSRVMRTLITDVFGSVMIQDVPWLSGKIIGFVCEDIFIVVKIDENEASSAISERKPVAVSELMTPFIACWFSYGMQRFNIVGCIDQNDFYDYGTVDPNQQIFGKANITNFSYRLPSDFKIDYFCVPAKLEFLNNNVSSFPSKALLDSEYRRVKLPVMPDSKINSSSEGLFELYWNDSNKPDEKYYFPLKTDKECIARDPWELVRKNSSVAIDFGTSSTVVAVKDERSHIDIVRMGSFGETVEQSKFGASQYENPTVLNFVDFNSFMKAWTDVPYRPDTDYCSLQFSHDAKAQVSDRPRSCMTSIKTWCRSDNKDLHIRLTDEQNFDFELEHQKLSDETDVANLVDSFRERGFDPVEVYAYLLGCSINNQSLNNGSIYLNYYMTFPVKFDNCTKARIMEGFKRGLARSLPPSLVYSEKWKQQCAGCGGRLPLVEEIASEPIVLAASFLEAFDISPTDDGIPFGVFDFGGGTTDFAVGIYRNATETESEDYGYEIMLDVLDASGDQDLGGEHLVDMLAFEVIRDNISDVLKNRINFVLPYGYSAIPGSETVWSSSSSAYENFSKLSTRLRSLWESAVLMNEDNGAPETDNNAQMNIMFKVNELNDEGIAQEVDKTVAVFVDQERMRNMIRARIRNGFERFLAMVKSAVDVTRVQIESLHVIISGNSCHSPLAAEVLREFDGITRDGIRIQLHSELLKEIHCQQKTAEEAEISAVEEPRKETEFDSESVETPIKEERCVSDNKSTDKKSDYGVKNPLLTLKTGVALGIFKLLRGETMGFVERNKTGDDGEAPFNFYVGKFVKGCFCPVLLRNSDYHTWIQLDRVRKTLRTRIAWTCDPTVVNQSKKEGDTTSCFIDHVAEQEGWNIFIRPETPHSIRVAVSSGQEPVDPDDGLVIEL